MLQVLGLWGYNTALLQGVCISIPNQETYISVSLTVGFRTKVVSVEERGGVVFDSCRSLIVQWLLANMKG